MKDTDYDKLEISMVDELDKIFENDIYETIENIDVREGYTIMRSV